MTDINETIYTDIYTYINHYIVHLKLMCVNYFSIKKILCITRIWRAEAYMSHFLGSFVEKCTPVDREDGGIYKTKNKKQKTG